jgi:predicted nuclease of predicted toxin-antitoxin system
MSVLLPEVFVDHCLGTKVIPDVFRQAGFVVLTIEEKYGKTDVEDVVLLRDAGTSQLLFVTKDTRIRQRKLERAAVFDHKVRLLCFVHQNVTQQEMAKIFNQHMNKIIRQSQKRGPWIATVSRSKFENITSEIEKRYLQDGYNIK